jgi:hypothetical protein
VIESVMHRRLSCLIETTALSRDNARCQCHRESTHRVLVVAIGVVFQAMTKSPPPRASSLHFASIQPRVVERYDLCIRCKSLSVACNA